MSGALPTPKNVLKTICFQYFAEKLTYFAKPEINFALKKYTNLNSGLINKIYRSFLHPLWPACNELRHMCAHLYRYVKSFMHIYLCIQAHMNVLILFLFFFFFFLPLKRMPLHLNSFLMSERTDKKSYVFGFANWLH